jgi:hypothetical protein
LFEGYAIVDRSNEREVGKGSRRRHGVAAKNLGGKIVVRPKYRVFWEFTRGNGKIKTSYQNFWT